MRNHIAITGGMGSGKGYIISKLWHNAPLFDCDAQVRQIVADLGLASEYYNCNAGDQPYGEYLIDNPPEMKRIQDIVFPILETKYTKFAFQHNFLIAEVPLLYESNWQSKFDTIIVITAPLKTRLSRIAQRRNQNVFDRISPEYAKKLIDLQWTDSQKTNHPSTTFVINNK